MDFAEAAEQLEMEDKRLDAQNANKKQRLGNRQVETFKQTIPASVEDSQFDLSCQRSEEPDIRALSHTRSQGSRSTATTETDVSTGTVLR